MKKPVFALLALLLFIVSTSKAQSTKPAIFANYPSIINIDENAIRMAFQNNAGQSVTIPLGQSFNFSGKVISNVQKYENLRIIIIKSTTWQNTLLQLAKTTNADNIVTFSGRIINPGAADGFEIKRESLGSYKLKKTQTDKIFEPCNIH